MEADNTPCHSDGCPFCSRVPPHLHNWLYVSSAIQLIFRVGQSLSSSYQHVSQENVTRVGSLLPGDMTSDRSQWSPQFSQCGFEVLQCNYNRDICLEFALVTTFDQGSQTYFCNYKKSYEDLVISCRLKHIVGGAFIARPLRLRLLLKAKIVITPCDYIFSFPNIVISPSHYIFSFSNIVITPSHYIFSFPNIVISPSHFVFSSSNIVIAPSHHIFWDMK